MISIINCSVCGSELAEDWRLEAYPLLTSACRPKLDVPLLPLAVGHCSNCSHVQLTQQPTQEQLDFIYLGDYTSVHKQGALPSVDQLALDCRAFFNFAHANPLAPNAKVLEIGCFDGAFLSLFTGCELYGCEPNPMGRMAEEHHHVRVIPRYFSASDFTPASFDLIVMRHLIEHLPDPLTIINECRSILQPNGGLLIETPNIEHTFDNHVVGNLSHQHLHYFSRVSLPALLARAGLRVAAHACCDFRQFVLAIPDDGASTAILADGYAEVIAHKMTRYVGRLSSFHSDLSEWRVRHKRPIAIWGASSIATGIVYTGKLLLEDIAFLVDVDPRKRGMVLPGTQAVVDTPNRLARGEVDTVLIASDFFKNEILEQLHRDFSGQVKYALICNPDLVEAPL